MYDTALEPERVVLVGVSVSDDYDIESSIHELGELAKTAGAVKAGVLIQNREKPHTGTYIGKGKIEELRELIIETDADSVICDDELSPVQIKNLSEMLDVKVIDRTVLILDIFAKHASTVEGKIQVELAQLAYRSSHLSGSYSKMSRLGGGIGTRGPGEQKIESDRRVIHERMNFLRKELEKVDSNRQITRKKRMSKHIPIVAIVGYTNAGKSTLLNFLTDAKVLSEDKLFATLDPTTRKYKFEDGEEILFTDTVGFVRKLPHHLIKAFNSTLQEAGYADLILHVVDITSSDKDIQMDTVYETLDNLKIKHEASITAFNKTDKLEADEEIISKDLKAAKTVRISAKTGEGIDELLDIIRNVFRERKYLVDKTFTYNDMSKITFIRENGQLIEESYEAEGIYVKAYVPGEYAYMFENDK